MKNETNKKECKHEWQSWSDHSTNCKKCGKVLVKPPQLPTAKKIELLEIDSLETPWVLMPVIRKINEMIEKYEN